MVWSSSYPINFPPLEITVFPNDAVPINGSATVHNVYYITKTAPIDQKNYHFKTKIRVVILYDISKNSFHFSCVFL